MLNQLRDLDMQLLRLFVCVVECAGFSAAQGELGIGQSTISTQMAKLETRLGFRVCSRGKAGFRLTPKGEQVLQATYRLLQAIDIFKDKAQSMADKLLGELHIGLSEALDTHVLERIGAAIGRFRRRNQAVLIQPVSAMPAELERRLLQDQLQLAIGYFSGNQSTLDYQPLFSRTSISRDDLASCDLVYHPYRFITENQPLQTRQSSGQSEQVEGCLALILSGAHIGYLPEHIAAHWLARGRLRALLPDELKFTVQFNLTSHRGRHPGDAQQALVEDLMQEFVAS